MSAEKLTGPKEVVSPTDKLCRVLREIEETSHKFLAGFLFTDDRVYPLMMGKKGIWQNTGEQPLWVAYGVGWRMMAEVHLDRRGHYFTDNAFKTYFKLESTSDSGLFFNRFGQLIEPRIDRMTPSVVVKLPQAVTFSRTAGDTLGEKVTALIPSPGGCQKVLSRLLAK